MALAYRLPYYRALRLIQYKLPLRAQHSSIKAPFWRPSWAQVGPCWRHVGSKLAQDGSKINKKPITKQPSKKVSKRAFLEPKWARETSKGLIFILKGPSSRGIASSRARDAAEGCIRHHKTTKDTPKVAQEPPGATPISRPFCRPGAPNHPKTTPRPPQDTPEARLKPKWLRGTSRS